MAKALGLIEVRGKLGAILAADAAVKAANVTLLGSEEIRGGLTTVHLIGDVAAVKAAVEAGEIAVKNKNCLISSNIIPRLDEQVERMLLKSFGKKEEIPPDSKESNQLIIEEIEKGESLQIPLNESKENLQENLSFDKGKLEKMKVADLRSLAHKSDLSTIKKSDIKYANKAVLIEALLDQGVEH